MGINRDKKIPRNESGGSPLSAKEKEKILRIALERMVMIGGKVFGLEDDAEPEAIVDCAAMTESCKANCCTYVFALTHEEVGKRTYKFNPEKPYYMARDPDGYCPYLDRVSFKCGIHDKRPLRCRKYACSEARG